MIIKKIFLNVYFWPVFLFITLAALVLLPLLLLGHLIFIRHSVSPSLRKGIRIYGWVLARVVPFMAPVEIEDRTGGLVFPVIFTPNHFSSVDPYLFGMIPCENAFITSWPYRIPVFKWVMRLAGYIDANKGWDEIFNKGKELLDKGCSLVIWPEGHRSRDGSLGRFLNGAFQLSCKTKTPVVPVCIVGTDKLFPPSSRLLNPRRVKMILLPPVLPPENDGALDVHIFKNQVRKAVGSELEKFNLGVFRKENYKKITKHEYINPQRKSFQ